VSLRGRSSTAEDFDKVNFPAVLEASFSKYLTKRLRGGSGRIRIARIDVSQRAIEAAVPKMLTDHKRVRALLDHEHSGRVF
jgi:hypothetical protein